MNVKKYKYKKDYIGNPSTCICENSKYLKIIADTSVTECDEIIIVMDTIATKKTNAIAANVMSTASINCCSAKVRDCCILHTVLLGIILPLIIIIICCYCYYLLFCVKNCTCHYFHGN